MLPDFLGEIKTSADNIKETTDRIHHFSAERYSKLKSLIQYLEHQNQGLIVAGYKHISQDVLRLENLKQESDELSSTIDELFIKKDIDKFIAAFAKI